MCLFLSGSISVTEILMFVVIGLALGGIITIIVFYATLRHKDQVHYKEIKELSNSLRIFVIDVQNDKVRYFNSAHLKERKTTSITSFYNQFTSSN